MQAEIAAPLADLEAVAHATAVAHAVLLSPDLCSQQLWRWLDRDSKIALRVVCKAMRSLVDGAVEVVTSASSSASGNELRLTLLRWPGVRHLTLLNVSNATALDPLSAASLAGLTSLTVRGCSPAWRSAAPTVATATIQHLCGSDAPSDRHQRLCQPRLH
ncbi:hypothetical protein FOA52_009962 [Chlamydomonas sp. UWO 241]|nr:hypothetical protein FOA52_009962 [Chlamydomonas sp. UWO 241]